MQKKNEAEKKKTKLDFFCQPARTTCSYLSLGSGNSVVGRSSLEAEVWLTDGCPGNRLHTERSESIEDISI